MCLGCGHKYRPPLTPQQRTVVKAKPQATLTAPTPVAPQKKAEASKATPAVKQSLPINLLVHRRW
jgi:hypothetical protein